uniref:NADH:ubiquinone oxidoreductase intermediate-associated protein 30 domain-containing protein n=1 Tax=Cacopsylla melanoneura TaxID=428564 RepID=A0A8D8ZQC2_9HEMI
MTKFLLKYLLSVVFLLNQFNGSSSYYYDITSTTPSLLNGYTLFDFSKARHLKNWAEVSDSTCQVGQSKAVFTLHKSPTKQRGVFFTLLTPNTRGACFAGYRTDVQFDISKYNMLVILGSTHGTNNTIYKVLLQHNGLEDRLHPSYEYSFLPDSDPTPTLFQLPLDKFKPIYHGRYVSDALPLNKANITRLAIISFGGSHEPSEDMDEIQRGVSCFEIDYIKAIHSDHLNIALREAYLK